jgi:hypothetical protein
LDEALHTPNPHYTPPTVVFLDSAASQVLATVIYEPDFAKRSNGAGQRSGSDQGQAGAGQTNFDRSNEQNEFYSRTKAMTVTAR